MKKQLEVKVRDFHFKPLTNYKELVEKAGHYTFSKKKENGEYIQYLDLVCAFDIETSSFLDEYNKRACMYIWQFAINGYVYLGRTWEEFEEFMEFLHVYYDLSYYKRLVIYIHNLSYEFQWLCNRFKWINIFAREERKPLKALTSTGIEFRCSYILSGTSLETVGKNLTTYKIEKKKEDLDYNLIRGPETELSEEELGYCINDVLVLTAYIWEQLDIYGKITKIPMTNTGRVRNLCKNSCFTKNSYKKYKSLMKYLTINNMEEYDLLKRAFSGGFTHGNYMNVKDICYDVKSFDFTSSYPACMIAFKYPMSKGKKLYNVTLEYMYMLEYKNCYIFNIKFKNLRPRLIHESPISISKCIQTKGVIQNNGRIIKADEISLTLTNVDMEYISKFYEWDDYEIGITYEYKLGYLPSELVNVMCDLYEKKTSLKDVKENIVEYLLSKGMLNSMYGMMVMDIVNNMVDFSETGWISDSPNIDDKLKEYNESKSRFTFYPWGVFVTAYARRNLFTAIEELGQDYIYSDTDSVKFMNYENHKDYFEKYNNWIIDRLEKACDFHKLSYDFIRPKTIKGVEKPLGVWDDDGYYIRFKTLGAKRYLVEKYEKCDKNIKMQPKNRKHINHYHFKLEATIAGVNKKKVSEYLLKQEDPFKFFDDNMVIPAKYSGKNTHTYIDEEFCGYTKDYKGNEFYYHELSAVHMGVSDYNLTISDLYAILLNSKTSAVY